MKSPIKICIVNYNTQLLVDCLIKSINKYTPNSIIYIFDNSDKEPFVNKFDNVIIFDNTKGQIINFDKWLNKYPNRVTSKEATHIYGSAKHCYTVDKIMQLINDNFILMDSDILLKKDISELFDENYVYVGHEEKQPKVTIVRVLPFICFINVKMCKLNNIHYFDEEHMHGLNMSKEGDWYDTGAWFYKDCHDKNLPIKTIDYKEYIVHFKGGSWEETHQKRYNLTATSLDWLNENNIYWEKPLKKVIYTCVTNDYEPLDDPIVISKDYDYVCFTNSKNIKSEIYEIRPIPKELKRLSEVKRQRYIKMMPHKYLKEYDISVWIDACVYLKKDINKFVDTQCKHHINIPQHPDRGCIYKEMEICSLMKKDTEENINNLKEFYQKEGFPINYGLAQTNIIIRRHNEDDCIKLMETWWEILRKFSHRDQLSFNYALWKNPNTDLFYLPKNTFNNGIFFWDTTHHGKFPRQSELIKKKKELLEKMQNQPHALINNKEVSKNLIKFIY